MKFLFGILIFLGALFLGNYFQVNFIYAAVGGLVLVLYATSKMK